MMKGVRYLSFFTLACVVLVHFRAGAASELKACDAKRGIALDSVTLDFSILVPENVIDQILFKTLSLNWSVHLQKYLTDKTRNGFKHVNVNVLQVADFSSYDLGCLTVFPGVDGFTKLSVKHTPHATNSRMLLAAAIFSLNRFKKTVPVPSTAVGPAADGAETATVKSDPPVLRVTTILAEGYSEMKGGSFKGDGTDTCGADYPTQQQVKEAFSDRNIDFFLYTSQKDTQAKWSAVFDKDNAFWSSNEAENKMVISEDPFVVLLEKRLVQIACQRFKGLVVDIDAEPTTPPTATETTQTTITPPPPTTTTTTITATPAMTTTTTTVATPATATSTVIVSTKPPSFAQATSSGAAFSLRSWLLVPIGTLVVAATV